MHVQPSSINQINHDPAQYSPPVKKKPNKAMVVLGGLGLLTVIAGASLWYFKPFGFLQTQPNNQFTSTSIDTNVIMTVGSEQIYGEDLKYELSLYPESMHQEVEPNIRERLIKESVILQAAAEEELITLDGTVFNAVMKDRQKRRQILTEIEEKINKQAAYKKGAVVSIWFMNYTPAAVGYEAARNIAFEKISKLHTAVKNRQMTIKQAGEAIKKDTELAQVDKAYEANAYYEFDTTVSKEITLDPNFNQEILSLSKGEVSDLTILQSYERRQFDQPKKDALYIFAQVTNEQPGDNEVFADWYAARKDNYAVVQN